MMSNKPSLQSAVVKSIWSINYFLWEFKSDVLKESIMEDRGSERWKEEGCCKLTCLPN